MKRRKAYEPLVSPGVPTFTLTAGDRQIVIATVTPGTGGAPSGYRYQIRRRNNANTRWANTQGPFAFTTAPHTITALRPGTRIFNGLRYQVRLSASNAIGSSGYSAWQEVTPTA